MFRVPFVVASAAAVALSPLSAQVAVPAREETPAASAGTRPIPYPVEVSSGYRQALERGTRSMSGQPGPDYWQQWADYAIDARLDTEANRLDGTARITYHNRSPNGLPFVVLQLPQDVHREGAVRNRPTEVTGGFEITRVTIRGEELSEITGGGFGAQPGYQRFLTLMLVRPSRPIAAGDSVQLEIDFGFAVPESGMGRMGRSRDNLFHIAYWYPQLAVYDDVVGWHLDPYQGTAEFYMGYGSYDVRLEVPHGWAVMGTGSLANAEQVLPDDIVARLRRAEASDTVVHVLTPADRGPGRATRTSDSGYLEWRFTADTVRDVTYSVFRESRWDAARTPVGDRDGDGTVDYARVDAIWRDSAPRWEHAWRYAQHSIDFLSRWTGFPYPWPHMTSVEGGGIIGGGMEFPMITLIGSYNESSDTSLYGVHAHELAHMWVPMIVGTDERRRAWMDEGTTSFNTAQAQKEFYPGRNWDRNNYQGYLGPARAGMEGELMRYSDLHEMFGPHYGVASYAKPATLLSTLRALLGEETFVEAYQTFIRTWAYKHPKPWDLFNTFNHVSGQNLDWFWRTWYYETWTLDQGLGAVTRDGDVTTIVVEDHGLAPMPARLSITLDNGETVEREVPVSTWLSGARSATVRVESEVPVVEVVIDADQVFPDVNRENNEWRRRT